MRRASSQRGPKWSGKLSRRLRRTFALVSWIDQSGLSIAAIVMFNASWMVTQLSTRVLSQSNRIARGRGRRQDAAGSVRGPLTSATPTLGHIGDKFGVYL